MFVGRKKDLDLLEEKWNSDRFEFGCIYGQRRIGKTALINKFIENKPALYFQAKEASELENRRSISRLIDKEEGYPLDYVFPSWSEIFEEILKMAGDERFAFIIDEYPYLARSTKKGIASYLQDFIDNHAHDSKLFLLLLGSNVSFMEKELGSKKSPLYRRRTFSFQLRLLTFTDALLFLAGFNQSEKLDILSFFGFSPYYLSLLDSRMTFRQNLESLLFQQSSTLLDVPDIILSNGTREKRIYNTVLLSVARGRKTPAEIANDIGIGTSAVSPYLKTLLDEDLLEKKVSFGSKRNIIYRIKDPVLDFFYARLYENAERIRIGFGKTVYQENEEFIHQFICHRFEDICIHYMEEKSVDGKLEHPYWPIQNFTIEHSELGRSVEIDGLSAYKDSLLVVECKYRNSKRSRKDYEDMKADVSIHAFERYSEFHFYLFSKTGFEQPLLQVKDPNLHLISGQDMLSEDSIE